jgi:hypothetical protein
MWILFSCEKRDRFVIRTFVGGVNAISGEPLTGDMTSMLKMLNSVTDEKQDYLVVPKQHWLDGIATTPGVIKQFVATPMLSPEQQETRRVQRRERGLSGFQTPTRRQTDFELGASIELQVTGYDKTGGLQLAIIPEYDVDRMSFSVSPNTVYKGDQTLVLGGHSPRKKLDVLRTPRELGFVDGDKVHMKDLDNIGPDRPKVLGDLWAEATDDCRISNGVALEVSTPSWFARLNIACGEFWKPAALEVEVRA